MNIWTFIYSKYQSNINVILLYVLTSSGSSPGRQGFKMAVAADGALEGSIGGGIMEHKFVEMAKAVLLENAIQKNLTYQQIHSKEQGANRSGMICSGEQTIFLHRINQDDIGPVQQILLAEKENKSGTIILTQTGIDFLPDIAQENFYFEAGENDFLLKEKIGFKNSLHIVGGGHCALALSALMSQMDFYIHVYDDRKDLNTVQKNSYAHEIHLVDSYTELASLIEQKQNVFVVIMTFGYRSDDLAVRALMNKKFTYTGIMGSKKKIEQMFHSYRNEGVAQEILGRLHAPIGLQIRSQTPAEIAVSIAAEIIQVKNAVS